MNKISNTEYQELRNKIWGDLVSSGVTCDDDDDYQGFDNVLGQHLNVDWDWNINDGSDVCYRCGKTQRYQTMKDVNEDDFAIYCDECHPIVMETSKLKEFLKVLKTNINVDWDDASARKEFSTLADILAITIRGLENINRDKF